ncbi:nicotinamide mononucleotide transporter PnuC [Bacteroidales bacterium 6E]|nr:nicotinamide mononucleotide transporter PnuC [Bacteroidales bacterium 6E]
MSLNLSEWLSANYIELAGAILGIAYIYFSIRQHILTWITGLLTSLLYIVVFYQAKFYADMGLQFYYVAISIYGWYLWKKKKPGLTDNTTMPIIRARRNFFLISAMATWVIFLLIRFILERYTDSMIPNMDAATTALSITATYMLARKMIEHWIIWVVVDVGSAGLYIYKGLWATSILFLVYTIMAVIGYKQWKNELLRQ